MKCKKKTQTNDIKSITTKNSRKAITGTCNICGSRKYMFVSNIDGSSLDIHKLIGKLPRPSKGWVPGDYKYLGPYNPLHKQISFDNKTGEIHKIHEQPKNRLDEIAMNHDICYTVNSSNKGKCDRKMVKDIDSIPYKDMNKTTMLARTIMNKQQQLGLGVKQRHEKGISRRIT